MISMKIILRLFITGVSLLQPQAIGQTCSDIAQCFDFTELSCIGTSRTVCLRTPNRAIPECDTITNRCGVVREASSDLGILSTEDPCVTVIGGTDAQFSVTLNDAYLFTLPDSALVVGTGGSTVTASCEFPSSPVCQDGLTAANTATWTFTTTPCVGPSSDSSCTCTEFSIFSPCSSSCTKTRTRTCTARRGFGTCAESTRDTQSCTGGMCLGCACDPVPEFSACSTTCGGTQFRRRRCLSIIPNIECPDMVETRECPSVCATTTTTPESCTCSSFQSSGECEGTCGTGTQNFVRTCSATCASPGEDKRTFSCNTGRSCLEAAPLVPDSAATELGPVTPALPPGCTCGLYAEGACSVTCGFGLMTETRSCSPECPPVIVRSQIAACNAGSCPESQSRNLQQRSPRTRDRNDRQDRKADRRERKAQKQRVSRGRGQRRERSRSSRRKPSRQQESRPCNERGKRCSRRRNRKNT